MLVFCASDQRHKISYLLPVLWVQIKFALWLRKNSMFMLARANSKVILEQYWKMFRKSKPSGVKSDLIWDPGNSLVKESNLVVTECLNKNISFKAFYWCTWSWLSCFYISALIRHSINHHCIYWSSILCLLTLFQFWGVSIIWSTYYMGDHLFLSQNTVESASFCVSRITLFCFS